MVGPDPRILSEAHTRPVTGTKGFSRKTESINKMAGRSSYSTLSAEIQAMYERKKQTSAEYDRRDGWRRDIHKIMAQKCPECRLVFFGSTANFGTSGCDIDLTLFLPHSYSFGGSGLYDIARHFPKSRFQTQVNN